MGTVSLPIAMGLLLMMYPVLAKVRYEELGHLTGERRLMASSLLLNGVVGPALMFALAWVFLADQPEYPTGLIIVGLARCIAMVLICTTWPAPTGRLRPCWWRSTACSRSSPTAFWAGSTCRCYPAGWGLDTQGFEVSMWEVARTVLIFLGIPLAAGFLTRMTGIRRRGERWYAERFLPRIAPLALYAVLFTIVMLFALQGNAITANPGDVVRIAVPLLVSFAVMFAVSFAAGVRLGLGYPRTAAVAFTAASNNFELAIAVAVGMFGATSGQALAGVVGPLIEVPVLVGLVYASLSAARRWRAGRPAVTVADS